MNTLTQVTPQQVVSAATCTRVLAVLATTGLYERSGKRRTRSLSQQLGLNLFASESAVSPR